MATREPIPAAHIPAPEQKAIDVNERWTPETGALQVWSTRRAGLLDDGHIEAAPHGARQIDQGIAEAATCPHCLGRMSYAPLWNRAAKSYYAFAVCGQDDVAVEF